MTAKLLTLAFITSLSSSALAGGLYKASCTISVFSPKVVKFEKSSFPSRSESSASGKWSSIYNKLIKKCSKELKVDCTNPSLVRKSSYCFLEKNGEIIKRLY